MSPPPPHRCRVLASPWPGVYAVLTDSARHFGKHSHATHGLGLLLRGAHGSASGRGPVEAVAGDLITTNPGEVHDGRPLGGAARRWGTVYLEPEVLAEAAGGETRLLEITRPVIRDAQLAAVLQRVFAQLEAFGAGRAEPLACEEALAEACGLAAARHTARPARACPAGDVARVRERLADDFTALPSLGELAALAGLSRFQLLRRFRAAYGLPPHAWLLQQRTERARRLIQSGQALGAAAQASGFADQPHMTRCFTRQYGFTPGAWQRAVRPQ
jgi:AraC-like DNA-binding protein